MADEKQTTWWQVPNATSTAAGQLPTQVNAPTFNPNYTYIPFNPTAAAMSTYAPSASTALSYVSQDGVKGRRAVAEQFAKSALIPNALRGKPDDVLIILLTAEELGIGYMLALRTIAVIDGKPNMSADLIAGLVLRSPLCEEFRIVETNAQRCVIAAKRRGAASSTTIEYTLKDAETAKLLGKQNWRENPRAMLVARCKAAAGRAVFPDLVGGLYDPDELHYTTVQGSVVSDDTELRATEEQRRADEEEAQRFIAELRAAKDPEVARAIGRQLASAHGYVKEQCRPVYQEVMDSFLKREAVKVEAAHAEEYDDAATVDLAVLKEMSARLDAPEESKP